MMLSKKEDELSVALESGQIGQWDIDLRIGRLNFSSTVFKLLGLPEDHELDYSNFLMFFCGETSRGRFINCLQSVLELGFPFVEEFKIITTQGIDKWIRVSANPVSEGSQIQKISGTIIDISRYFERFPETSTIFQDAKILLDSTEEMIWSLTEDGTIIRGNSVFTNFFKRILNRIPTSGRKLFTIEKLNRIDVNLFIQTLQEYFNKTLQGYSVSEQVKVMFLNEDFGNWFDIKTRLVQDSYNKQTVVFHMRDISEGKLSELIQETMNEKLVKVNFELDRFVYAVSHDLRAPILAVSGLIDLLNEKLSDKKVNYDCQLIIRHMKKSLSRIDNTVQNILNYSRNIHKLPDYELINLHAIVHQAIENHVNYHKDSHKIIQFITKINTVIPFYSDKYRITVLLTNLISNAIRFQRSDAKKQFVEISFISNEDIGILTVTDNGEGIEDGRLPFIFDMFFRGSAHSEGSGLGLYIVNEIVKAINGSIVVSKNKPYGTKFEIKIPNMQKGFEEW
ncbi:MAG: PAS domain-containing sensor histidine kinase [Leptospiraceae bacterium]|nr:PAS domain-containing sensor histidine kinase [Leptospiraceae bacterium]